jgi:uroporphyrinogen-III synthase
MITAQQAREGSFNTLALQNIEKAIKDAMALGQTQIAWGSISPATSDALAKLGYRTEYYCTPRRDNQGSDTYNEGYRIKW